MDYKDLTTGVEVEMTGITRSQAAKVLSKYFETTERQRGQTYIVYDREERNWSITRDGSINCQRRLNGRKVFATDDYSVELVTPILRYDDIETLQELLRKFRKEGAFVNNSCGIHVHIGVKDFDTKQLRNLCNICYSKQDLIFEALAVRDSRLRYCNKLTDEFVERLKRVKPAKLSEFSEIWYEEFGGSGNRESRYNASRYRFLNLHNLLSRRQPTAEFRLFNGSLHAGKVKAYVQFCLTLVAYAYNAKSTSSKKSVVRGSHKYAFRVFLLKLNMIGDDFKTARLHLLSKLEGNAAWRDRA